MRHYKSLIFFLALSFLSVPLYASAETIPLMIPHTGTIKVNGTPFNGMGQFKFAITNGHSECATSPPGSLCKFHWTNDNRSPNGTGEPENSVTIFVNNGIFAVRLGDTTLTHMQTIPTAVFENAATSLRVWFNDGVKGSQWLSPDRPLAAVPYAYHAETAKNVVSGGVTSTMIANNAVTTTQIVDGTIGASDLAFDPATQDELNSQLNGHKGSGDHDSRYLRQSGGTMTGAISLPNDGIVFLDNSRQTRAPRLIYTPDTREGCPPAAAANTDLYQQVFTLTNSASVLIQVDTITNFSSRVDIFLYVDNVIRRIALTPDANIAWKPLYVIWGGMLAAGQHTVSIRSPIPNSVGCGSLHGAIATMIFE